MSKTKTVMVDRVGGISYPENFISANKIAQLGSNIDVEFGDITSYGSLICKATDSVLNFSGLMELGVNRGSLIPYGYISIASEIGLELPNTIITKDSLSIYDGLNSMQNNTPFVVIGNGGITTTGHLTASSLYIETNPNSAKGWNFVNGSIRYYDTYCSSEINAYNYCPRDGAGYSTIELAAHKYNQGSPDSSVSININGRDGITLCGPVTVNNTLLEDMIATAVSSIDLSGYQTKLNYYSESVYDDGSNHVFITAEQTKIGDNKTYIDVMPYYYSKSITIQNDEGDINISSNTNLNLGYTKFDSINKDNYSTINNQVINIGCSSTNGYYYNYYELIGNTTNISGKVINIGGSADNGMSIPGSSINLIGTAIKISSQGISPNNTGSYIKLDGDNISLEPDPSPNDGHIKMGTYFTAPVYTENDDGSYTKTNKTVALRVVERDGT
jgi:hypothetical protein